MILNKREIQNSSPEQVREYIVDALNLTAELDPPADLRVEVFKSACNLLSAKHVVVEQMQASPNGLRLP